VSPPQPKVRKMTQDISDLRKCCFFAGITPQPAPLKVQPIITNTRLLQLLDYDKASSGSFTPVTENVGYNVSNSAYPDIVRTNQN